MKSDPQLREDIRALQADVMRLQLALDAARNSERFVERVVKVPVEVERVVEKPVKVMVPEYRDSPEILKALARAKDEIAKLRAAPEKVREVKVAVEVEKVVDRPVVVPVVEYRDSPATIKALEKARAEIAKLRAQPPKIERVNVPVEVERIVEKPVRVVVTEYKDSPATLKALEKARSEIERLKAQKPATIIREVPVIREVTKYVDRVVMTGGAA